MDKSITVCVGLDVHSIDIATADADAGREGEVRHIGTIGGDLAALDRALRKLISKGCVLHVVYEAGPCGFVVWRHLSAKSIQCEVVAPSSIARPAGQRIKTDRRDATLLARSSSPPCWRSAQPVRVSRAASAAKRPARRPEAKAQAR